MIIRKIKVAFLTSILVTFVTFLIALPSILKDLSLNEELILQFLFIFNYSLIGNYIYGLPVSLVAEWVTSKLKSFRMVISGLIHIGFGLLSFNYSGDFFFSIVISSILFFLTDEVYRR
ncbi:hypothetical protein ACIQAA_09160 [Neobacillus sp. NPDC093182]|uniref:hypothetical protein n=1 Tax=Neobacillus sp. NPDC093182 TaxID=3364297 RepID=UPI003821DD43